LDWDINTHQNSNSQKKQQWPVGMGHDEHESQLNKEHTLHCHHTTMNWSLHCTATPPKDKAVKTKTPSSLLALSLPTMSHTE
jgi:hypothetical protein